MRLFGGRDCSELIRAKLNYEVDCYDSSIQFNVESTTAFPTENVGVFGTKLPRFSSINL